MTILGFILCIIFLVGSIVFFANGITAIVLVKGTKDKDILYSPIILWISGFSFFLVLLAFVFMLVEYGFKPNKTEIKYEKIDEPIYRQIKPSP